MTTKELLMKYENQWVFLSIEQIDFMLNENKETFVSKGSDDHIVDTNEMVDVPQHPPVFSENGNELLFDEEGNLIKENQQEISDGVIPPNLFILSLNREEPIIIIDEEGFKYKGELIKDSGEIYKLFKEFLQTSLLPQQEISDEEIQAEAIKRSSKYQDSALFENTWEEAIEWYKEKLQLLK